MREDHRFMFGSRGSEEDEGGEVGVRSLVDSFSIKNSTSPILESSGSEGDEGGEVRLN